jgi:hypothetical protein
MDAKIPPPASVERLAMAGRPRSPFIKGGKFSFIHFFSRSRLKSTPFLKSLWYHAHSQGGDNVVMSLRGSVTTEAIS